MQRVIMLMIVHKQPEQLYYMFSVDFQHAYLCLSRNYNAFVNAGGRNNEEIVDMLLQLLFFPLAMMFSQDYNPRPKTFAMKLIAKNAVKAIVMQGYVYDWMLRRTVPIASTGVFMNRTPRIENHPFYKVISSDNITFLAAVAPRDPSTAAAEKVLTVIEQTFERATELSHVEAYIDSWRTYFGRREYNSDYRAAMANSFLDMVGAIAARHPCPIDPCPDDSIEARAEAIVAKIGNPNGNLFLNEKRVLRQSEIDRVPDPDPVPGGEGKKQRTKAQFAFALQKQVNDFYLQRKLPSVRHVSMVDQVIATHASRLRIQ